MFLFVAEPTRTTDTEVAETTPAAVKKESGSEDTWVIPVAVVMGVVALAIVVLVILWKAKILTCERCCQPDTEVTGLSLRSKISMQLKTLFCF